MLASGTSLEAGWGRGLRWSKRSTKPSPSTGPLPARVGGVTTKPTAAEHRYSVAGKEETRKERPHRPGAGPAKRYIGVQEARSQRYIEGT
jgi:hypothetical protein